MFHTKDLDLFLRCSDEAFLSYAHAGKKETNSLTKRGYLRKKVAPTLSSSQFTLFLYHELRLAGRVCTIIRCIEGLQLCNSGEKVSVAIHHRLIA